MFKPDENIEFNHLIEAIKTDNPHFGDNWQKYQGAILEHFGSTLDRTAITNLKNHFPNLDFRNTVIAAIGSPYSSDEVADFIFFLSQCYFVTFKIAYVTAGSIKNLDLLSRIKAKDSSFEFQKFIMEGAGLTGDRHFIAQCTKNFNLFLCSPVHSFDLYIPFANNARYCLLKGAARGGHVQLVQDILRYTQKVEYTIRDYSGRLAAFDVAITSAAESGHRKLIAYIFSLAEYISSMENWSDLICNGIRAAAEQGDIRLIKDLLARGKLIPYRFKHCLAPIIKDALKAEQYDCVKLLFKHRKKPDYTDYTDYLTSIPEEKILHSFKMFADLAFSYEFYRTTTIPLAYLKNAYGLEEVQDVYLDAFFKDTNLIDWLKGYAPLLAERHACLKLEEIVLLIGVYISKYPLDIMALNLLKEKYIDKFCSLIPSEKPLSQEEKESLSIKEAVLAKLEGYSNSYFALLHKRNQDLMLAISKLYDLQSVDILLKQQLFLLHDPQERKGHFISQDVTPKYCFSRLATTPSLTMLGFFKPTDYVSLLKECIELVKADPFKNSFDDNTLDFNRVSMEDIPNPNSHPNLNFNLD